MTYLCYFNNCSDIVYVLTITTFILVYVSITKVKSSKSTMRTIISARKQKVDSNSFQNNKLLFF